MEEIERERERERKKKKKKKKKKKIQRRSAKLPYALGRYPVVNKTFRRFTTRDYTHANTDKHMLW
jgi:formylglycine-generating enzyme required for sulfatase activity